MNKSTFAASLAAALALGVTPAAGVLAQQGNSAGNTRRTSNMKMGMSGMQALKRLSGKEFDAAFLSQMIAHHQGGIQMARAARPTLKDDHVQEHAQDIITGETKEIREMGALLQSQYKAQPSAAQMNLMKADMRGMMAMKPNGDHMFLEMMIPHHRMSIDMSRLAVQKSGNSKVKAVAGRIIKDQTAEIADFQKMLSRGVGKGQSHSH